MSTANQHVRFFFYSFKFLMNKRINKKKIELLFAFFFFYIEIARFSLVTGHQSTNLRNQKTNMFNDFYAIAIYGMKEMQKKLVKLGLQRRNKCFHVIHVCKICHQFYLKKKIRKEKRFTSNCRSDGLFGLDTHIGPALLQSINM